MKRASETKPRPGEGPASGLAVFSAAVYIIGALFIVVPVFDLLLNLWPMSPGNLGWRYGAVGLFANFLHTPLLGALIVTLFAAVVRDRRLLLAFAIAWGVTAAALGIALAVFSLDALQMRSTVLPESLLIYHTSVARAVGKHLTGAIAFGLLGRAAWRAGRALAPGAPALTRRVRTPLARASDEAPVQPS